MTTDCKSDGSKGEGGSADGVVNQKCGSGFYVVQLPFAGDIFDNEKIIGVSGLDQVPVQDKGITDSLSKEEKQSAKLLVKNLTINFDIKNFENPKMQQFLSGIESLALQKEAKQVDDLLEPDYDGLQRLDSVITKFRNVFLEGDRQDYSCWEKKPRGKREPRQRGGGGGGRGGKRKVTSSTLWEAGTDDQPIGNISSLNGLKY